MNRRNMAVSNIIYLQSNIAVSDGIPIDTAIKEGYKINPWAYVAIQKITSTASSVPWHVYGKDGKIKEAHKLSQVLKKPNPAFSMQDCIELLTAWLQIQGKAYLKRVDVARTTVELWPVSPARIRPFVAKDNDLLVKGYSVLSTSGIWSTVPSQEYTVDNIIAFKLLDPSNPVNGIGPMNPVADMIDTDNEIRKFNRNALKNRLVVDGAFTFKETLVEKTFNYIKEKIKDRFTGSNNAREPLIIGADATYTRLALTPVEMDFNQTATSNRDAIFIAFGVPPQLAGSQESSTYNNFDTSQRIFWEAKIIPLLDQIADTLNSAFSAQLLGGEYIKYDLSGVKCLKETDKIVIESAKVLFDMGVPVSNINEMYKLGIPEFENWDKPYSGGKPSVQTITTTKTTNNAEIQKDKRYLIPNEKRDIQQEIDTRENIAETIGAPVFYEMLHEMELATDSAIEANTDPKADLYAIRDKYMPRIQRYSRYIAYSMASTVSLRWHKANFEYRADDDPLSEDNIQALIVGEDSAAIKAAIDAYLLTEAIELRDVYFMTDNTVNAVLEAMRKGIDEKLTIQQIKDILVESGEFSPSRALAMSRTLSTPCACIGQLVSALDAGAETKTWHISGGGHTRKWHVARNGERVPAQDGVFSAQINSYRPRWPGDTGLAGADRINCRCGLEFH